MRIVLIPLISITVTILDLYIWALILSVIMNWLVVLDMVNMHSQIIYLIRDFLYRITEPTLCLVRRSVPRIGGIDLSPVVLVLCLVFLKMVLQQIAQQMISNL